MTKSVILSCVPSRYIGTHDRPPPHFLTTVLCIEDLQMSSNHVIVSDYVKEYPDMLKIYIYHNNYIQTNTINPKKAKLSIEQKSEQTIHRSIRRTRSTINDLLACNRFDLWCTFTFNPDLHNRYDLKHCKSVMSLWLARRQRQDNGFAYLVVPELHKDGALHFHALIRGYNGTLKATRAKTKTNQTIYKITGYRGGRSNAVKLDDNYDAIAGYLQKYITKDMPLMFGQKRYWTSTNLTKPTTTLNGVSKFHLMNIVKNYTPEFINDYFEVQYHNKAHGSKLTTSLSDPLF